MAIASQIMNEFEEPAVQQRTGAEIMCDALVHEGVRVIFGYPGGAIMPFYDALYNHPMLHHVLVRHEQAGAHAADGFARASGQVGVCIGTSGPGATNLVTGLATAYMDNVPIVAITGQVARPAIGKDSFQETDVIGVTISVTKHNILVNSAEELGPAMHEAFAIARSGKPGPVLIDIPKDVQFEKASYRPQRYWMPVPFPSDSERGLREAAEMLDRAQRPVMLAGHGIIQSRGCDTLRRLAEHTGIPVITTLLGISAFPESHPLALGMPGMHGAASTNHAIDEADVILAVGMRFDDRVTGKISEFAPKARIIHIDIEPAELEKVVPTAVPIHGDAKDMMERLCTLTQPNQHAEWLATIRAWERPGAWPEDGSPQPPQILQAIKQVTNGQAILVSDVGQHQMWTARHYGYCEPNSHITSGGLGTMGFSLPAAMGVKFGRPDKPVWVVAGDGGIQMNIQELATIAQEGLDIKVVIMNNGYLGMVRQWQKFFHGGRYSSTPITGPDYVQLAAAYGLQARRVERSDELQEAMEWAATTSGCVILDVAIEQERNVYPMIPSGASVASMIEDPDEVTLSESRWNDE
ncbi:MAG: acetolactate synthase large subunit [Chloroflexota bacterium]